eukprot:COSAG04_NODE_3552_length_2716_cov_2.051204_2_plen_96_part_00
MFNGLIVVAFALEPVRPGDGGFICVPGCAPPPEPPDRRSALTLMCAVLSAQGQCPIQASGGVADGRQPHHGAVSPLPLWPETKTEFFVVYAGATC